MNNSISEIVNKFCRESKPIVKQLEFRNNEGSFLFAIKGDVAYKWFKAIQGAPEFTKTTKKIKGKEFIVLEAMVDVGYTLGGTLEFILHKGGYIKVIN